MSASTTNETTVKLEWITPDAQHMIAKCARVSNPANQENRTTEVKLLKYLATHKHWSPFEMASMCLEIHTTRAISAQIIRHRSFAFQEFSQRFAVSTDYTLPYFRSQDYKNRQNSFDDITAEQQEQLQQKAQLVIKQCFDLYNELVGAGVAKESARMILPLCTNTTIYMTGSIRSWIHYIQLRADVDTQKEHRDVAEQAKQILLQQIPSLAEILE
jgi:thymidylate synthase (FAD)